MSWCRFQLGIRSFRPAWRFWSLSIWYKYILINQGSCYLSVHLLTRLSLYLMIPPACLTYIYRKTDHSKSQFSHRRTETNLSLFFHYQYIITRSYSMCSYVCAFCFFLFLFFFFHKNPLSNKRFYVKTWYFALFSYRFCCSSYKEMTCQSLLAQTSTQLRTTSDTFSS